MKVSEVRERSGWERLQAVWNPLLSECASATTFLTWEWLTAWWSAYGNARDLRILTAVDDSGLVRGIAPLRRQTVHRYGRNYEVLALVGDGSADSDYLDFIVARGFEQRAVEAWLRHLGPDLASGVILALNEVPAASPCLASLKQRATDHLWVEHPVSCGSVCLPRDWNEYLGTLRPRFRTKVRSVLRNLETRGDIRFGFCHDESELERLLPALFELHTRRWNHDGRPGVFGWDRKRAFYRELSPALLRAGALRFSWMEWNGRLLACQYGFVHGDTYMHLQEGYEPASEHWNVGIALRAWSIREMQRQGICEYDFLAGVGRHKTDWGAQVKESRRIIFATRTPANLIFCRGPEWEQGAKEAIKRLLPAKVMALRAARHAQPDRLQQRAAASRDLLRRAAASCYLRLGLPTATERLRKRYEVSIRPNGRLPRFSVRKRTKPAGRIFCYHRVNDEADPFFPAMPVATFERQIRFVATHYRIVSLSDLMVHLDSGSSETVVVVTFDDGYRDNYENAFPILQRYGAPATIFLTTGCLDSGQRPWFEQLAAAIKLTEREQLDVELDLPRRFSLRSPDQRLAANGRLFELLRTLPDRTRHECLSVIFKELGRPAICDRGDAMLTWNQVRLMKGCSIEFGGHTVTHPLLSRITPEQRDWEISECKRRIEEEIQASVRHFAYPNGRSEDFVWATKDAIRQAGYEAAVTTIWGLNHSTTDRLELRRSGPWEQDEALFASQMDYYELVNG